MAREFRKLYKQPATCLCGQDLSTLPISYYVPHSAGWTIKAESVKAWLFVHCPHCNYEMALWKIGVAREK